MWLLVYKKDIKFPQDRPFLAYWRKHICIIQYSYQDKTYICSAYPAEHMHMIQLRPRDLNDITHWMELPKEPTREAHTGDTRASNWGKYPLRK